VVANPNGIASYQPRLATLRGLAALAWVPKSVAPATLKVVASIIGSGAKPTEKIL
jgi:hypothetical protein